MHLNSQMLLVSDVDGAVGTGEDADIGALISDTFGHFFLRFRCETSLCGRLNSAKQRGHCVFDIEIYIIYDIMQQTFMFS